MTHDEIQSNLIQHMSQQLEVLKTQTAVLRDIHGSLTQIRTRLDMLEGQTQSASPPASDSPKEQFDMRIGPTGLNQDGELVGKASALSCDPTSEEARIQNPASPGSEANLPLEPATISEDGLITPLSTTPPKDRRSGQERRVLWSAKTPEQKRIESECAAYSPRRKTARRQSDFRV